MNLGRSLAVSRNIFLRLKHDRRTLGMIFVMPILFIGLFGFAFSGEPEEITTIVVSDDTGLVLVPVEDPIPPPPFALNISDEVVQNLDTKTLSLQFSSDIDEAVEKVRDGEAWAVINFPENFTSHLFGKFLKITKTETLQIPPLIGPTYNVSLQDIVTTDARIEVHVDASNTQIAAAVVQSVTDTLMRTVEGIDPDLAFSDVLVVNFTYGENARFIDFFAPGIMALLVTMITIMLTIISFVRERTNGTLDRLYVSPMEPTDIIAGYSLTFTLIAIFQSIEIVAIGVLFFDIQIVGSIALVLLVIVLYAIGLLGLGFLLSTIAKNEFQAVQFIPLVFIPSIILAGVIWPIESMPPVIRPASFVIPLTYAASALRSIMIRGWGPLEIGWDILALVIFAVLMFILSIVIMKRKAYQR